MDSDWHRISCEVRHPVIGCSHSLRSASAPLHPGEFLLEDIYPLGQPNTKSTPSKPRERRANVGIHMLVSLAVIDSNRCPQELVEKWSRDGR